MRCTRRHAVVFVGCGSFIFILSLIALIAFPSLYRQHVQRELSLSNNAILFNVWKDWPFPTYQKIYFFNVTNAEDFFQKGAKLKVKEIGPYTYQVKLNKEEFEWKNETLSYREFKTYTFDREMSVGSEDDVVYSLNGPLFISADYVIEKEEQISTGIANILYDSLFVPLVVNKTVRELGFGGYEDILLEYESVFPDNLTYLHRPFGWFYGRNGTDDGAFKVGTGLSDPSDINVIKEWNGLKTLPFWKTDTCNKFRGGNGLLGPPFQLTQNTYSFFRPVFCRSLTFEYTGSRTGSEFQIRRFENTRDLLANPDENASNCCYQTKRKLLSGVKDVGSCNQYSPFIMSFPHFYLGDESYLQKIDGLFPSPENHKSFIEIEPLSGITMNLTLRYQMNIFINSTTDIVALNNVTGGLYPVYWVETETKIGEEFHKKMKKELEDPKKVGYIILGVLLTISGALLISGLVLMNRTKNRMYAELKPLLRNDRQDKNYLSVKEVDGGSEIGKTTGKYVSVSKDKIPIPKNIQTGDDNQNNIEIGIEKVRRHKIIRNEFHCNVKDCTIPSHHKISEKTILD